MKNIKCIWLLPVICIYFFVSCKNQVSEKKFFDIPAYFKSQIDTIHSKYSILYKFSNYNGDTSVQKINIKDVNWDKEFAMFLECNLNSPVYYANAEKTVTGNLILFEEESYQINSGKTFIKSVLIRKKEGKVFQVNIELQKENLISSTKIKLFYDALFVPFLIEDPEPEIYYTIEGEQILKGLGEKTTFLIKGIVSNRN